MTDNPLLTSSTTTTGEIFSIEDPRAFYNKETGTWRLEDDDGNELEYDQSKGAWFPLVRSFPSDMKSTLRVWDSIRRTLTRSRLAPG